MCVGVCHGQLKELGAVKEALAASEIKVAELQRDLEAQRHRLETLRESQELEVSTLKVSSRTLTN